MIPRHTKAATCNVMQAESETDTLTWSIGETTIYTCAPPPITVSSVQRPVRAGLNHTGKTAFSYVRGLEHSNMKELSEPEVHSCAFLKTPTNDVGCESAAGCFRGNLGAFDEQSCDYCRQHHLCNSLGGGVSRTLRECMVGDGW